MNQEHPLLPVKWFLAEMVGTAFLAMTVGTIAVSQANGALAFANIFLPLAVGVVVMALIYTIGYVTGAHFNPAVTVALYIFKAISTVQGEQGSQPHPVVQPHRPCVLTHEGQNGKQIVHACTGQ